MYACIHKVGRGFFEGVCSPSNATTHLHDPPPTDSRIAMCQHLGSSNSRRSESLLTDPISCAGQQVREQIDTP